MRVVSFHPHPSSYSPLCVLLFQKINIWMRIVCVIAHAKTYMRHVFRVINLLLLNNSFMPSFLKNLFSIAFVLAYTHIHRVICKKMSMKHVADPFTYIHIEREQYFSSSFASSHCYGINYFCVCSLLQECNE